MKRFPFLSKKLFRRGCRKTGGIDRKPGKVKMGRGKEEHKSVVSVKLVNTKTNLEQNYSSLLKITAEFALK